MNGDEASYTPLRILTTWEPHRTTCRGANVALMDGIDPDCEEESGRGESILHPIGRGPDTSGYFELGSGLLLRASCVSCLCRARFQLFLESPAPWK